MPDYDPMVCEEQHVLETKQKKRQNQDKNQDWFEIENKNPEKWGQGQIWKKPDHDPTVCEKQHVLVREKNGKNVRP